MITRRRTDPATTVNSRKKIPPPTSPVPTKGKGKKASATNEEAAAREHLGRRLMAINSMLSRASLASHMGQSYGGDRDLYTALGYPSTISYDDYLAKYKRGGYSRRVINAFPNACWRERPAVYDDEDPMTASPFEEKWQDIVERLRIWNILRRADVLSGIGRYGGLFLGIGDGNSTEEPVVPSGEMELNFITPVGEGQLSIAAKVTDMADERYGLPELYRVQFDGNSIAVAVHWSRIIHIADNLVDSDVYGSPRLECVFNNIIDLEKLTGGSAEMFWRGAFPGLGFLMDKEADLDTVDLDTLQDEIDNYIHKMNRYMKLQGIDIKELSPQVVDPKGHVDVQLMEISAATGIPKRLLIGTEEARLAGGQDADQWRELVEGRRLDFCEEAMIRPLVDRLVDIGVLDEPKEGRTKYMVEWPEADSDPEQEVRIAKDKVLMMKEYLLNGMEVLMPPEDFLQRFLGMDQEEVKDLLESINLEDLSRDEEEEEIVPEMNPTPDEVA